MPFEFDLSALLALRPRQVLLRANAAMKSAEATSLSSDHKSLLLRSVAMFLDSNGFSKTLKRFLSEADISKEALKGSEVLEEIYSKYLEICGDAKTILKVKGEKAVINEVKKLEKQPEEADKDEDKKKKKKNKNKNSSPKEVPKPTKDVKVEEQPSSDSIADETRAEEKISKSKTKKSKKDAELNGADDDEDDDSKSSKKRKRSVPDETQTKPLSDKKIENEESKRRKVTGEDCRENETVINDSDHQVNDAEKSGGRKSAKKEINGSSEPKTVKAFQRVKVDEVEFTDERLKDNSYWAKSGAEIGYGAKAEEVLSQVRGRGFRHEKTKKKRGSYRGGQIDQGSHSIKFNYSDEE